MKHGSFGAYFKELRLRSGMTLRTFCHRHRLDPGNMSRLERGLLPPPQSQDALRKYAQALGLREGGPEWFEFFDRAAAERGRLPQDILSDAELVRKLPVVFRTLRGRKVNRAALDRLAERIRRA